MLRRIRPSALFAILLGSLVLAACGGSPDRPDDPKDAGRYGVPYDETVCAGLDGMDLGLGKTAPKTRSSDVLGGPPLMDECTYLSTTRYRMVVGISAPSRGPRALLAAQRALFTRMGQPKVSDAPAGRTGFLLGDSDLWTVVGDRVVHINPSNYSTSNKELTTEQRDAAWDAAIKEVRAWKAPTARASVKECAAGNDAAPPVVGTIVLSRGSVQDDEVMCAWGSDTTSVVVRGEHDPIAASASRLSTTGLLGVRGKSVSGLGSRAYWFEGQELKVAIGADYVVDIRRYGIGRSSMSQERAAAIFRALEPRLSAMAKASRTESE